MRILSFIPAIFLAVTGFVSAAPVADSVDAVSAPDNESGAQRIINAFTTANSDLQPLSQQLSAAIKASPPDVANIGSAVSQITKVVSNVAGQLNGGALTASEASRVGPVAREFIRSLSDILYDLVPYLKFILSDARYNIVVLVRDLLSAVHALTRYLTPFLTGTLVVILQPVLAILDNVLDLLGPILASLGL